MIWLGLLKRFWPYLAFALAAMLILGGFYRSGYKAGESASAAFWQPRFDAADKARIAADARTESLATASTALTQRREAEHAETLQSLNDRAAASDVRVRGLMRQLATASRCEVPAVPGTTTLPDDSAEVQQRADTLGSRIVGIGRDCEADAATLAELQRWISDQRAILN